MNRLSLTDVLQQVRTLLSSGSHREAKSLCESILLQTPNCAEAHRLLGAAEFYLGDAGAAIDCLHHAIRHSPNAEYYDNLSVMLFANSQFVEAESAAREALKLDPGSASAANSLGRALRCQDRITSAEAAFRLAIQSMPQFAEAHTNLCNALCVLGRFEEAERVGRTALALGGIGCVYANNLARALAGQEKYRDAIELLQASLTRYPADADGVKLLGVVLGKSKQLAEAESTLRRAARMLEQQAAAPASLADAVKSLAQVLLLQGEVDEAAQLFRKAVALSPDSLDIHSNLLECEQYRDSVTPEGLADLHREWADRHCKSLESSWQPSRIPSATDRIRLGFVSPDLYEHPVGRLLVQTLEHLDRQRFETIVYTDRLPADELSRRIERSVAAWRFHLLTDEELTDVIRADQIDILFDLSGHTAGNRLSVFARRAAPVQISWLGYVGTTGVPAMDFLLADRRHVRPEEEKYYTERILTLPDGYVCFDPPADAPPVSPLPAIANGRPTFGCFGNPAKIEPRCIETWAAILHATPGEPRIFLNYHSMNDPAVCRRIMTAFADSGIASSRVQLEAGGKRDDILNAYSRVDIALDSFPYSGGITTCEALWMGVPLLTFPGATFAGRHAASHLTAADFTELIATDRDAYIRLAVALAADIDRLQHYRQNLRQHLAASSLCDAPRFAKNLEEALLRIWPPRFSVPSL